MDERQSQWIGLLDCNNFFVSCERLFRPDLLSRPTVVLSSNDGCVVARSKEIKEMGIPMGVPYFQVQKELKKANAAVFSSNFALYRDISRRVMEVLREEVGYVEQYSVDEAFFALRVAEDSVLDALTRIKHAVETRVGIPVSVGAANTKTIAKYASEVGKKGEGVSFVYGENWVEERQHVPVETIWGIGRKTSQKLHEHGINTVSELLACDQARVDRLFGIGGLRIRDELNEVSVFRLGSHIEQDSHKSIMSTRSFGKSSTSLSVIEDAVSYHVAHVCTQMRELSVQAGRLSVMLGTSRHGDWMLRGGKREVELMTPTNDTHLLLHEAHALVHALFEKDVPYKKAGVVVGNFRDESVQQGNLFSEDVAIASSGLMKTLDSLNKRFGKESITFGRNTLGGSWQTSKKFVSPNYTTNWDEIAEIKL